MLEDVYAQARACRDELARLGLADEADRLDRALHGATSGEVLADVGARVTSVLASDARLPGDLRDRLRKLRRDVDRVLRRAGRL